MVSAFVEVSAEGNALKFYEVAPPFTPHSAPEAIMIAARTLSTDGDLEADLR